MGVTKRHARHARQAPRRRAARCTPAQQLPTRSTVSAGVMDGATRTASTAAAGTRWDARGIIAPALPGRLAATVLRPDTSYYGLYIQAPRLSAAYLSPPPSPASPAPPHLCTPSTPSTSPPLHSPRTSESNGQHHPLQQRLHLAAAAARPHLAAPPTAATPAALRHGAPQLLPSTPGDPAETRVLRRLVVDVQLRDVRAGGAAVAGAAREDEGRAGGGATVTGRKAG
ncbi:hypothetical protein EDC01DRAFT_788389 [Geopyxis carbonaria]|nr:hypothetical protein EDC01DRAFT_788389 [Geopyxis carbonaria]